MILLPKIVQRKPADLLLAAEALFLLTLFRVSLALIPVRRILRAITHNRAAASTVPTLSVEESVPNVDPDPALAQALRVRWAIESVTRNAPIHFVCFPQTLAGYTMLRLRGLPSTMVYGVARSPEGELLTHTWLTLGDRIVLGGEGSAQFTPIERWT